MLKHVGNHTSKLTAQGECARENQDENKPANTPLLNNVQSKRIPMKHAHLAPLSYPHLAHNNSVKTQHSTQRRKLLFWYGDDDYYGGYDDDYSGGYDDDGGIFDSFCDAVGGALPSGCSCTDVAGGSSVNCQIDFGVTVGAELLITPCGVPACIDLDVLFEGQKYDVTGMCAGTAGRLPVPGVSLNIGIGAAGMYATYDIAGSISRMDLNFGLDACAVVFGYEQCAFGGSGFEILSTSVGLEGICSQRKITHKRKRVGGLRKKAKARIE